MRLWADWIVGQRMFGLEASLFLRGAIKGVEEHMLAQTENGANSWGFRGR